MFETIAAADLGSQNTRVRAGAKAAFEPTRAALDPQRPSRIIAVGSETEGLLNAAFVHPVRGAVAEPEQAAILLRRVTLRLINRKSLVGVSVAAAAPKAQGPLALSALVSACRSAGFRSVALYDSSACGALGAGLDIDSPRASFVADIGRETLTTAAVANGGVIRGTASRLGSCRFDSGIRSWFACEQGMLLSARMAEAVKKSLGSPVLRVSGREASGGLTRVRELGSAALWEALSPHVRELANEIAAAIDALPPDAAADLLETGVTLIGGGALMHGLPERLTELLGIPVSRAAEPETAVIRGLSKLTSLEKGSFTRRAAVV